MGVSTSNFIPSVLTFDPPSKQTSISTYRALKNARELLDNYADAAGHLGSAEWQDRLQTALDDLELMMGAVK